MFAYESAPVATRWAERFLNGSRRKDGGWTLISQRGMEYAMRGNVVLMVSRANGASKEQQVALLRAAMGRFR